MCVCVSVHVYELLRAPTIFERQKFGEDAREHTVHMYVCMYIQMYLKYSLLSLTLPDAIPFAVYII